MIAEKVRTEARTDAKQRLLLSAEALVAERGFEQVSTRDITAHAGVNLAAINYHYGSKAELLLAIFKARAAELNRERGALLQAALQQSAPDTRAILHALIAPSILGGSDGRRVALRFLNRARSEGPPKMQAIIRTDVRHLRRFADALAATLPHLDRGELVWRLHFTLGALHHNSAADYERLDRLSDGLCAPDDRDALLARLIDYTAAGFGI